MGGLSRQHKGLSGKEPTASDLGAVQKAGDTMTGDLSFSGNSRRITGDMSNATRANRLAFQTSTTNDNTRLGFLPNGTSTVAGIDCYDGADPNNAAFLQVHADGTSAHVGLNSSNVGTGTLRNLVFQISSVTKALINATSGAFEMVAAAINEAAYVTVASASTCNIGAAASNNVAISGTTTITSFGTANAGVTRRCRATGAFQMTYNATSLITTNGKNIITKADDCFTMTSLGSGNWIMTDFKTADGRIMANSVNNQTGTTYTFAITDLGNDVTASNASASTYTLPQTSNVAFPIGSKIKLINLGVGVVTLVKEGSENLYGNTIVNQYATVYIEKITSTAWQVFGGTVLYPLEIEAARVPSAPAASATYVLVAKAKSPFTITGFVQQATSLGTAGTYTININGVAVTGLSAVTNTTSITETSATAANTVSAGDQVTIVFSGTIATPVGWVGSLSILRTF